MVRFYEPTHEYTTKEGTKYISATTLIGKYKEPFDGDFWSIYKAIERTLTEAGGSKVWLAFKKIGYKTVNDRFLQDEALGGASEEEREVMYSHRKDILQEWEYEKSVACRNGTAFHKSEEAKWLSKEKHEVAESVYNLGNAFSSTGEIIDLAELPDGVYSELTLWNNFYQVAGQADMAFIETIKGVRYIDIDDYKTNKKIDIESYKNPKSGKYKMMLRPLHTLMDCNRQHYELQMSLYAYMLECYGFVVRNLNFRHYDNIGTKEKPEYRFNRDYPLTYRRKEIVKMLGHYIKNR